MQVLDRISLEVHIMAVQYMCGTESVSSALCASIGLHSFAGRATFSLRALLSFSPTFLSQTYCTCPSPRIFLTLSYHPSFFLCIPNHTCTYVSPSIPHVYTSILLCLFTVLIVFSCISRIIPRDLALLRPCIYEHTSSCAHFHLRALQVTHLYIPAPISMCSCLHGQQLAQFY